MWKKQGNINKWRKHNKVAVNHLLCIGGEEAEANKFRKRRRKMPNSSFVYLVCLSLFTIFWGEGGERSIGSFGVCNAEGPPTPSAAALQHQNHHYDVPDSHRGSPKTLSLKRNVAASSEDSETEGFRVISVEGGRAELPCDISAPAQGDSVYLVLWYKKESGTPIYSYDSRDVEGHADGRRPFYSNAKISDKLWSEPSAFGDRAHFRAGPPQGAYLGVHDVQRFDQGVYTCRVDFRQSPTIYRTVRLDVIVPPEKPMITDERGRQVTSIMDVPYRVGDSLNLECTVPGGQPSPRVSWYLEHKLLDDTFEKALDGRSVKNSLNIPTLDREHVAGRLRCLASNNNFTKPTEAAVKLQMLFPPQGAKIEMMPHPLTAGRDYVVSCMVWGANPPARVDWHRGSDRDLRPVAAYNSTVLDDGNVTISWVHLRPTPNFHKQTLTCRGSNSEISSHPDSRRFGEGNNLNVLSRGGGGSVEAQTAAVRIVEDFRTLEVFFPPTVELNLGRSLNPEDIEEGDDIYFECNVHANPPAYKLTWYHNGQELVHDQANGIIISNRSLALQKVTRQQAGSYTCGASNVEGDRSSTPLPISIMYKPVCLSGQKTVYGVSEGEIAHVACRVDAFPEADVFAWSFNTSSGGADLERNTYTNQGSASLLSYVPKSQMEYGTVLCKAANRVGTQVVPCVFHVIPAGPPDPPKNCTLTNQTHDGLQVECEPGFSSGLRQEFHMEVFTHPEHRLLVNLTAKSPKMYARGLPQDSTLFLRMYASTSKGRSRSVTFEAYTLRISDSHQVMDLSSATELEKQLSSKIPKTGGKPDYSDSGLLDVGTGGGWSLAGVVLIGIASTIALLLLVIALTVKRRTSPGPVGRPEGPGSVNPQARFYTTEVGSLISAENTNLCQQNGSGDTEKILNNVMNNEKWRNPGTNSFEGHQTIMNAQSIDDSSSGGFGVENSVNNPDVIPNSFGNGQQDSSEYPPRSHLLTTALQHQTPNSSQGLTSGSSFNVNVEGQSSRLSTNLNQTENNPIHRQNNLISPKEPQRFLGGQKFASISTAQNRHGTLPSNFAMASHHHQNGTSLYPINPYSPTSDSSGFSERDSCSTAGPGAANGGGGNGINNHNYQTLPQNYHLNGAIPSCENNPEKIYRNLVELRSMSPQPVSSNRTNLPQASGIFGYNNPSMSASPYSTLPRKQNQPSPSFGLSDQSQVQVSTNQNFTASPFADLRPRSANGRSINGNPKRMNVSIRSPLLITEEDRESNV